MYPENSCLNNPVLGKLILAVLVHRLGGEVTIAQEDIDQVAFGRMDEAGDGNSVTFKLERKEAVQ